MKWLQMWQQSPPYNLLDSNSNPQPQPIHSDSCWPQISKESQIHLPWAFLFGAVSSKSLYYPSPSVSFGPSKVMQPTPVPEENYLKRAPCPLPILCSSASTESYHDPNLSVLPDLTILTPTSASVPLFSPRLILILTKTLAQVIKMEAIYNLL